MRTLATEVARGKLPNAPPLFVHMPAIRASPLQKLPPDARVETINPHDDSAVEAFEAVLDRVAALIARFATPAEIAAARDVPDAVVSRGARLVVRCADGRPVNHATPADLVWLKLSAGYVFAVAGACIGALELNHVESSTRGALVARVERDELALMLLELHSSGAHAVSLADVFPLFPGSPPAGHPCPDAWRGADKEKSR